jgi:hypothetical protein
MVQYPNHEQGLKGRNSRHGITLFQGYTQDFFFEPGATRFALAPGFYIPRLRRCSFEPLKSQQCDLPKKLGARSTLPYLPQFET